MQVLVCNFIKKSVWHRCFPVNFVKFFDRTASCDCFWIYSTINFLYELPHELVNNVRLRKYEDNLKTGWEHNLVIRLICRNKFLATVIKNYQKADIKVFCSFPVLPDFLLLVIYFA